MQRVEGQSTFTRGEFLALAGGLIGSLGIRPAEARAENFYTPANGRMSVPWGPFYYNSLSGYSIRDRNGFLGKLYQASINLGLPSPDPINVINQYIAANGIEQHPAKFEIGLCPGVPRAAILSPEINGPIIVGGVSFNVFERRAVALYRFFAAAIKRDANGYPIDWGTSNNPFSPSEFHYLNMALYEQGIAYGLNTKENHDLQPWWRPAYYTAVEKRGNNWRGWVEVADYIYPAGSGILKRMEREFEYELDPDNPLDPGRWIKRDRLWAGFQVDPDINKVSPQYAWQRESFNILAADMVIGIR